MKITKIRTKTLLQNLSSTNLVTRKYVFPFILFVIKIKIYVHN